MRRKNPRNRSQIREFLAFIRAKNCVLSTGAGISGYLLFNHLSGILFFLFLAIFFTTAAVYCYSLFTDRKEDKINNGRLNVFVTNGKGRNIAVIMLVLGVSFSLFLPLITFLLFLIMIPFTIAYSRFRLKRIFIVKNLYTALGFGLVFIIGASAGGILTYEMLYTSLLVFPIACGGNMIGDIMGYKGDLTIGVRTLPVVVGLDAAKRFVEFILLGFSVSILISGYYLFYPLAPFGLLGSFFLAMDRKMMARICMLTSFPTYSAFLLIKAMIGGG
jgi:4-hydroxybenzoate polyprenyltransferase